MNIKLKIIKIKNKNIQKFFEKTKNIDEAYFINDHYQFLDIFKLLYIIFNKYRYLLLFLIIIFLYKNT